MNINQVSFGFTTDKVQETKEFYEKYLGATTIFEKDLNFRNFPVEGIVLEQIGRLLSVL